MTLTSPLHQELGKGLSSFRTTVLKPLAVALWGAVLAAGSYWMSSFAHTPGSTGDLPGDWPKGSLLTRETGVPTLLFFAHPRCSCTVASLEQLKSLITAASEPLRCHVIFLAPAQPDPAWELTPLVKAARQIPGVTITLDRTGECQRFGVTTSGHALMYDSDNRLVFSGGLTVSRGHRGDSPGAQLLAQRLNGRTVPRRDTPTFGCPLVQNRTRCLEETACRN